MRIMRGLTCFQYSTSCLLDACACIDLLTCCFVACCVLFVCVVVYRFVRFSLTHSNFWCIYVMFFGAVLMLFWCLACLPQGTEGEGLRGNPSQRRVQYIYTVRTNMASASSTQRTWPAKTPFNKSDYQILFR